MSDVPPDGDPITDASAPTDDDIDAPAATNDVTQPVLAAGDASMNPDAIRAIEAIVMVSSEPVGSAARSSLRLQPLGSAQLASLTTTPSSSATCIDNTSMELRMSAPARSHRRPKQWRLSIPK